MAQQARPKLSGQRDPCRAQFTISSDVVLIKCQCHGAYEARGTLTIHARPYSCCWKRWMGDCGSVEAWRLSGVEKSSRKESLTHVLNGCEVSKAV